MSWMAAIALAGLPLLAAPAPGATVKGHVSVRGAAAENAVVYLQRAGDAVAPAPPTTAVMDQKNLHFLPGVLVVQRGTTVEFHNSDDLQHNVFTPSDAGGRFNLGTYERGGVRAVSLDEIGELVILCNIHMEMQAHILVVRDPYFAVSDAAGAYAISGVPPGEYTLRVWRDRWSDEERRVVVADDGDVQIDVGAPR